MGSPAKKCVRCAKPGKFVVNWCSACRGACCEKHIRWSTQKDDWLCTKCKKAEDTTKVEVK